MEWAPWRPAGVLVAALRTVDEPQGGHIDLPTIPSLLANLHLDLAREMTTDEVRAYMHDKLALAEEVLAELVLRALASLGTDRALVTLAPVEGFLHPVNETDSLGLDQPESQCHAFAE